MFYSQSLSDHAPAIIGKLLWLFNRNRSKRPLFLDELKPLLEEHLRMNVPINLALLHRHIPLILIRVAFEVDQKPLSMLDLAGSLFC